MNVLSFISNLSPRSGGPSRSVPMLIKGLAEQGIDITLASFKSMEMNLHSLEGSNAKVHLFEKGLNKHELCHFLIENRFDLIQTQSIWETSYHVMSSCARELGIPYIVTPRGMLEPWSLRQKSIKKRIALSLYQMKDIQHSNCIYATSELEAQNIRRLGVSVPISVIPNGLETKEYNCRTSIDNVKKQVLFLSRIHKKKGIELLIHAWNRLKDDYKDWRLLIVGNGDTNYIESLHKLISNLGLNDCIQILPPVFSRKKQDLYQESSLFCLPSYSENFGMVLAEAMSCGVPVITTRFTPWEFINGTECSLGVRPTERTGWCIDLGIEELESTLRSAISMDKRSLFEMGQKGSKLVQEYFDYHNIAKQTLELYEWVIFGGKTPSFVFNSLV